MNDICGIVDQFVTKIDFITVCRSVTYIFLGPVIGLNILRLFDG